MRKLIDQKTSTMALQDLFRTWKHFLSLILNLASAKTKNRFEYFMIFKKFMPINFGERAEI